ncbi:uncharacterized protein [Ptychodera flava]|uniref:uncharacterized protein n=1 Tax=Ptychodera flava TaxID=63121 RepID=UPI00396A8837
MDMDENKPINLYTNPIGYYGVRVILALEFKEIPYGVQILRVTHCEHLEPWCMKLNPSGKLPFLQHRAKVISGSSQILEYLDSVVLDHRVLHPDKLSPAWQRLRHFQNLVDSFYIGDLVGGCYMYPSYVPEPSLMDRGVCKMIRDSYDTMAARTKELAGKHPEMKQIYETRLVKPVLCKPTEEEFQSILSRLQSICDLAENELRGSEECGQIYLFGNEFSAGDIYLLVFLKKLTFLGLRSHWQSGHHPLLVRYFEKMLDIPSCTKALGDYEDRLVKLKSQLTYPQKSMESEATNQPVKLYTNPVGYYGVRVMLALEYQLIPYDVYTITILDFEHLEPWFMKLNPGGKVPVLVHGKTILSGSQMILEYLDSIVHDPKRKLLPVRESSKWERLGDFQRRVDDLPMVSVIGGCYKYPTRVPERGLMDTYVCKHVHEGYLGAPSCAKELARTHPEMKEIYNAKLTNISDCDPTEEEFENLLRDMKGLFDFVESQLKSSKEDGEKYIIGNEFTAADIYLLTLLKMLTFLGFRPFWQSGSHPLLVRYFEEMRDIAACRKVLDDYENRLVNLRGHLEEKTSAQAGKLN